jgi:hypothetical protein
MIRRIIWRFFADPEGRWRWQQVSDERILLAQSGGSYASYDEVMRGARAAGYVYEAAQPSLKPGRGNAIPRR